VRSVTDVFNRAYTAEEVKHSAGRIADVPKLMPVVARHYEHLAGSDLERARGVADKLQASTEGDQNHVGVRVPMHVVDEPAGR
jgi:hypothetical protein